MTFVHAANVLMIIIRPQRILFISTTIVLILAQTFEAIVIFYGPKIILDAKFFFVQRFFYPEIYLGQTSFWTQSIFLPKIFEGKS